MFVCTGCIWALWRGGGFLGKQIVRVCPGAGQMRITIPKIMLLELKWKDVVNVLLETNKDGTLTVRRFLDGESLKNKRRVGSPRLN